MRFANTDVDRRFEGVWNTIENQVSTLWDNPRRLRAAPPSYAKWALEGVRPTTQV